MKMHWNCVFYIMRKQRGSLRGNKSLIKRVLFGQIGISSVCNRIFGTEIINEALNLNCTSYTNAEVEISNLSFSEERGKSAGICM